VPIWLYLFTADGRAHVIEVQGRTAAVADESERARLVLPALDDRESYEIRPISGESWDPVRIEVTEAGP